MKISLSSISLSLTLSLCSHDCHFLSIKCSRVINNVECLDCVIDFIFSISSFRFRAFEMEHLMKLVILLSLCGVICASSKPVTLLNSQTSQSFTSSLLTWESFNNDANHLKHAVVGGVFLGEDVSHQHLIHVTQAINSSLYRTQKHMSAAQQSTQFPCRVTSNIESRPRRKTTFVSSHSTLSSERKVNSRYF